MVIPIQHTIRRLRQARNLSSEQASKLVYVTRRTIELWEKGGDIPDAMLELYIKKLLEDYKSHEEIVVIFADSGAQLHLPHPVDAISEDIFLSIFDHGDGSATIASMAVYRGAKKPTVHRTRFSVAPHNSRAFEIAHLWQKNIGTKSEFWSVTHVV